MVQGQTEANRKKLIFNQEKGADSLVMMKMEKSEKQFSCQL